MMYSNFGYDHMWGGGPWSYGFGPLSILLSIFGLILLAGLIALKGYALWTAATRKEKWWFIAILILNTLGILEAVYLIFFVKEWHKKREHSHNHTGEHTHHENH